MRGGNNNQREGMNGEQQKGGDFPLLDILHHILNGVLGAA